jgi:hypothetical protein
VILYVNGDSHSAGVGVEENKSYAALLARHLNAQLVNQAIVGASNQHILRTTQDFLKTNHPDLVVIGWSTWEREEWEYKGNFYSINSSGHNNLPDELVDRYKHWVIEQTPELVKTKSQELHKQIYQLHQLLTEKGIPHAFFNCMYNVFGIVQDGELDWNNCYIYPYKNDYSYYWYLKNRGFSSDEWYHYQQDGHGAWAKFLIEYIDSHDIIR